MQKQKFDDVTPRYSIWWNRYRYDLCKFLHLPQTAQELRLTEDNAILQDKLQQIETQSRDRDGIEEDYRNIKEQFDEMEHQKHEAELAVAPLKVNM